MSMEALVGGKFVSLSLAGGGGAGGIQRFLG